MISQTYINPNKPKPIPRVIPSGNPAITYTPTNTSSADRNAMVAKRAKHLNISPEEWKRRDDIVRTLRIACTMTVGEIFAVPIDFQKQHGEKGVVTHIAASYIDIEADKWPVNDKAMIIAARSFQKNGAPYNYICTIDFPIKVG